MDNILTQPNATTGKVCSPANARGILRVLRLVTKAAWRDQLVGPYDPALAIPMPKNKKQPTEAWSILLPEHAPKFFAALPTLDNRWNMMLTLEMELGARFSELRALRPRHVDFDKHEVTIEETIGEIRGATLDYRDKHGWPEGQYRIGKAFYFKPTTKNNQKRVIPIDPGVSEMLKDYVELYAIGPDDLLFQADHGGPVGNSWFRSKVWIPFLKENEIPVLRLHDLRHTMLTYILDDPTISLTKAQSISGHKQLASLEGYVHLLKDRDRATVAARNRIYGKPERRLKLVKDDEQAA
jgi:integrase